MQWFPNPVTTRLQVSGAWFEVKEQLTVAEEDAAVLAAVLPEIDGKVSFDAGAWRRARVASFLIAWSLDPPVGRESVDSLTKDAFGVISDAIEAHEHSRGPEGNAEPPTTSPVGI